MSVVRGGSWALLLAGLASVGYAGVQGNLEVYLLVVVPVVTGTGPWAALGLLAAIAGIAGLLWTGASVRTRGRRPGRGGADESTERSSRHRGGRGDPSTGEPEAERSSRGGGVILIGPIPIVWGSDRSTVAWLVAGGIVLTLAAIGLTLAFRG